MPSKADILAWLDKTIAAGQVLAPIIPGNIDDLLVSFLTWARNDETFVNWLERFEPPASNAFTAPPEALIEALGRWNRETGAAGEPQAAMNPATFMQLMTLVLELVNWFKRRNEPTPAPAG